jgi:DnaJ-class molecular chaperone
MPGGGMGGMGGGFGASAAAPAIRSSIQCSLEELATGCTKRIKVTRKRSGVDSEKILEIVVKPGWRAGTTVTFENEGDEVAGGAGKPADLQFVIEERAHKLFQRDKNDLVMDVKLALGAALCGTKLEVPALDGRVLSLAIPEVITPGYIKRIKGEGMPITGAAGGARGDLVLRFEVTFPASIAEAKKAQLRALLA